MHLDRLETIGPLEQTTLRIAYAPEDYRPGETSHCEIDSTFIFSLVASLTPFCDFNQSPRNMYQCQMGKQTMAMPYHAFPHRVDTKTYRLHTPQSPIVRNKTYDDYALDEYALGTNAVVAVISYTGYDMEDAMIVNKMSYERGFGHGSLYLNVTVDLNDFKRRGEPLTYRFGNLRDTGGPPSPPPGAETEEGADADAERLYEKKLGVDGFPSIGQTVLQGEPLCAYVDESTGRHSVKRHKMSEPAVVEEVRLLGSDASGAHSERATIKLRINRNPVPGDKFSSRHGQKGVMSRLWPAQDMPFTESGITPDILFNPHGFPSRMTIGMLLESMAGKSGSSHGISQDSTPFRFSEKHRAVDYFSEQLLAAGYSYYGTEPMYSGVYGTEMQVQIFVGVVYYQRLRHMVSDKDQVRAKGPSQPLTRQPVHGRKVHGGIRLGEMERDALLAHGTSFILQERLLHCSDEARTLVCARCGSMLAAMMRPPGLDGDRSSGHCVVCGEGKGAVDAITIPYVFQYLTNELAAMNIKTTLSVKTV
jgi:DNA-directed RNA polymerase I subunit RPA2